MFALVAAGGVIGATLAAFVFIPRVATGNTHSDSAIQRFDIDKRFTDALKYKDLVFMSGQVGAGESIEDQTRAAFRDLDAALAKAGTDKSKVLELTIWLADIEADYDRMNVVYDQWIIAGIPPCRACVQAKLYSPECKIEVRAIAARV